MSYYIGCFKKYAEFDGRARRMEYWYFFLIDKFIIWGLTVLNAFVGGRFFWILTIVYCLGTIFPRLAVLCRRMHDTDHAGAWMLFPLVNFFIAVSNGTPGDNRFGPNPRFTSENSTLGSESEQMEIDAFEPKRASESEASKVILIIGLIAVVILTGVTNHYIENPQDFRGISNRINSTSLVVAETPEQAVDSFMHAVKKQDMEAVGEVYLGGAYDMDMVGLQMDDSVPSDVVALLSDKMQEFDYKVLGETVNGTTVTVDVEITAVNIGGAFEDARNSLMEQAEAGNLADDVTEEEIQKM